MPDLAELYREIILDHGRRPKNERSMEDADRTAEGYNPLCGDRVRVYVKLGQDRIEDISFTGSGCAICTASASLMTEHLKSRTPGDVMQSFRRFLELLTGSAEAQAEAELGGELGPLAALSGVRRFPMRVKCATLPWHTMRSALQGEGGVVSTE